MCLFFSCPLLYSKFHRSSVVRVLPWGLTFISKFLGVGLNFHDFNESKQPCAPCEYCNVRYPTGLTPAITLGRSNEIASNSVCR